MTARGVGALAAGFAILLGAACGKKGNPLPPVRPVPGRVADLSAHRVENRIELRFTVPAGNADGTSPPAISRVEIFRVPVVTGAQPLAPGQIMAESRNLRTELPVRVAEGTLPPGAAELNLPPAPGDRATFADEIVPGKTGSATAWSYIVVASAGRGRRGPPSAIVTVPLGAPPAPPEVISTSETETTLTLSWKPAAAATGLAFNVFAVGRVVEPALSKLLTPKPLTTPTFATPIDFDRERCFAVQPVIASAGAITEGGWSEPTCVTSVDTYPPAAPTNLSAIQEGAAIRLTWTAVESADLGGYVVLRGDASGVDMRPLFREPIRETAFRDTLAAAGATYTYSVYAVDSAATPNVSQQSNRQAVTVR